jgi:DinB superfamily
MDINTLLKLTDFTRGRLLGSLDAIEKSGQDIGKVLAWRPGPRRAHIAWQALHCAATHDKYLNTFILGREPNHPKLVADFGGGSTPADSDIATLADIRSTLATVFDHYRAAVAALTPADLSKSFQRPNGSHVAFGEAVILLAWHEAHHQGQIHLTWNLYQGSVGLK